MLRKVFDQILRDEVAIHTVTVCYGKYRAVLMRSQVSFDQEWILIGFVRIGNLNPLLGPVSILQLKSEPTILRRFFFIPDHRLVIPMIQTITELILLPISLFFIQNTRAAIVPILTWQLTDIIFVQWFVRLIIFYYGIVCWLWYCTTLRGLLVCVGDFLSLCNLKLRFARGVFW